MMNHPRKILYIESDFTITYFIMIPEMIIRSSLSIARAIELLNNEILDLVLSEPHQMVILTPQDQNLQKDSRSFHTELHCRENGSTPLQERGGDYQWKN